MKQRIFIGSSKEGLNVAKRVKEMLKENNTYFLSEDGKLFADGIAADLFL